MHYSASYLVAALAAAPFILAAPSAAVTVIGPPSDDVSCPVRKFLHFPPKLSTSMLTNASSFDNRFVVHQTSLHGSNTHHPPGTFQHFTKGYVKQNIISIVGFGFVPPQSLLIPRRLFLILSLKTAKRAPIPNPSTQPAPKPINSIGISMAASKHSTLVQLSSNFQCILMAVATRCIGRTIRQAIITSQDPIGTSHIPEMKKGHLN